MRAPLIRQLRMRIRYGFGAGVCAAALFAAAMAVAQDLSPATKRLFDAVWIDDLARVKASIADGADLAAVNELGVRPVDMAVDKGHYEIAHYLLSVEKQRRDTADNAPKPTPAERVAARAVVQAPVSQPAPAAAPSSTSGSGWLVGRASLTPSRPAPQPTPQPVPAPAPVSAVTQAKPAAETAAAPAERLWAPGQASTTETSPALKVVSVAEPRKIAPPAPKPAVAAKAASASAAPSEPSAGAGRELAGTPAVEPEPSGSGWLDRVTGFFDGSKPEQASGAPEFRPAQGTPAPAPEVSAAPEPAAKPATIAVQEAPAAADPPPAPEPPSTPTPPDTAEVNPAAAEERLAEETPAPADTPLAEDSAAAGEGPSFFDRITNALRPTESDPDAEQVAEDKAAAGDATPAPSAIPSAPPEPEVRTVAEAAPKVEPREPAPRPEAVQQDAAAGEEQPNLFDQLSRIFEPSEEPTAASADGPDGLADGPQTEAAPAETADTPQAPAAPKPAPQAVTVPETTPSSNLGAAAETAADDSGPNLLNRLTDLFAGDTSETAADTAGEPADAAAETAAVQEPEPAPTPADPAPAAEQVREQTPEQPAAPEADGPGLFDRLKEAFTTPDNPPSAEAAATPDAGPVTEAAQPEAVAAEPAAPVSTPVEPTPSAEQVAASVSEPAPQPEADGPGLFDRLKEAFAAPDDPAPAEPVATPDPAPVAKAVQSDPVAAETAVTGNAAAPAQPTVSVKPASAAELAPSTKPAEVAALAPEETPAATSEGGVFDRITNLFSGGRETAEPAQPAKPAPGDVRKVALPPQAATAELAQAAPTPAAQTAAKPVPAAEATPAPRLPLPSAPVGTPAAAAAQDPAATRKVPAPAGGLANANPARPVVPLGAAAPLKGVRLTLNDTRGLGARAPAPGASQCIDKSRWNTIYCIEPVAWPPELKAAFDVNSNFYRGEKSIVEYVAGSAAQIHVLFRTEELRRIAEHFTARIGPPTEAPEIWTSLIGQPRRPNRTLRWRSTDPETGERTVLEIREIDDLRWSSPPDVRNGVVRLFTEGRGSVFELLSSTDLLLVQLRRRR